MYPQSSTALATTVKRDKDLNPAPTYTGSPNPQLETLTHRRYSRERSRLLDRWLVYGDAEGFTSTRGQGVAL